MLGNDVRLTFWNWPLIFNVNTKIFPLESLDHWVKVNIGHHRGRWSRDYPAKLNDKLTSLYESQQENGRGNRQRGLLGLLARMDN
ncbi:hypothetical protein Tco_0839575 [Tanacetum coccineum]|uniref:Uncharacterized protein n=1 Tax=Tanacetum coccineum TaxID=301880 RepID=A0ABQ5AUX1_9ASTR